MTPEFVSTAEWRLIADVNNNLLLFAGLVIVAVASFLAAHAMIPSLVSTHELSRRALIARPVFYSLALMVFIVALLVVNQALSGAIEVVSRLFPRWLI